MIPWIDMTSVLSSKLYFEGGKIMTLQREIQDNIAKIQNNKELSKRLFMPTSKNQISKLESLLGKNVTKFLDFYREKQPYQIPAMKSKTVLLDIEHIVKENTEFAPGLFLSQIGIYVFATTIGGNVVCIDTNDTDNGDPAVLLIDQSFLYIDSDGEEVEIANLPSYINEDEVPDEDFEFNYSNVRKFVYQIEDSFVNFVKKYSHDLYDDFENYL